MCPTGMNENGKYSPGWLGTKAAGPGSTQTLLKFRNAAGCVFGESV